jgi:hypothetical protein
MVSIDPRPPLSRQNPNELFSHARIQWEYTRPKALRAAGALNGVTFAKGLCTVSMNLGGRSSTEKSKGEKGAKQQQI